jgi:hypothetical protein
MNYLGVISIATGVTMPVCASRLGFIEGRFYFSFRSVHPAV